MSSLLKDTLEIAAYLTFQRRKRHLDRNLQKEAETLRRYFEKQGGAFVKLGQFLSMRFDLLPEEYCYELFDLLDSLPTFPKQQVDRIFQQELHTSPDVIFKKFSYEPLASGSIGQVHIAYTHNNQKVAVKLLRPGIKDQFNKDISLLKNVTKLIDISGIITFGMYEIIEEFEKWLATEIDFNAEARNTRLLGSIPAKQTIFYSPEIYTRVPQIFMEYTSDSIITSEFIEGQTVATMLRKKKEDSTYTIPRDSIYALAKEFNKQCYLNGVFHADPHPGNIIVTEDNTIYFIDCSLIGTLPIKKRLKLIRYMRQLSEQEYAEAFDSFIDLSNDMSNIKNIKKFKEEFLHIAKGRKKEKETREQYVADISLLLRLANKYHRKTDPALALFLKTNALQTSLILRLLDDELKEKTNNNDVIIQLTFSLYEQYLQEENTHHAITRELFMQGLNLFENVLLNAS